MTDLGDACTELGKWITVTEVLLAVPDEQPSADGRRGTLHDAPGSAPPWNPAVADALLAAFFGIRRVENEMRLRIPLKAIRRGGSPGNTRRALEQITAMETAVDEGTAGDALRRLSRWKTAIWQLPAVDEAPRWVRLRRGAGGLPPQCPHCTWFSLRVAQGSGMVACFTPGCRDLEGNQPVGRLDVSLIDGSPVLAWRDGIIQ
jgi:hypothetical protein